MRACACQVDNLRAGSLPETLPPPVATPHAAEYTLRENSWRMAKKTRLNRLDFPRGSLVKSSWDSLLGLPLRALVYFGLRWWDATHGAEQSAAFNPRYPFQRRHLDSFAPISTARNGGSARSSSTIDALRARALS